MLLYRFIFSNFNISARYHLVTGENRENTGMSFEAIVYNGSYSNYNSLLLKAEQPTIEVNNLQKLAAEVWNTLKSVNPDVMHTYFKKGSHFALRK